MNKIIIIIICAFFTSPLFAQKLIAGKVTDTKGRTIPYVNIGIKGKKTGTLSDAEGKFKLEIADSLLNDSLSFSSVGFEVKSFLIQKMQNTQTFEVPLEEKVIALKEIQISNRKRKTYKLGITGRTPMVSIPSSSYQKHDIIEQARLIHIKEPVQVLNANIFVLSDIQKEADVRINFYAMTNGMPGERLIEKSIIKKIYLQKGWQVFDLKDEGIYLDEDFVVAFEFLPSTFSRIAFGAKVGTPDSYLRNNSLGEWRKNTVGGCSIYVTVQN